MAGSCQQGIDWSRMFPMARQPHTPGLAVEFASERDIVVELAAARFTRGDRLALSRAGGPRLASRFRACAAHAAAATTAEHLHLVGLDLGRVAVAPFLVLPLACAELALEVDLRALAQVFGRDLRKLVVHHDRVPFGLLALLTRLLVLPALRRGNAEIRDRLAIRHVASLRILTEIADENDLVDTACH